MTVTEHRTQSLDAWCPLPKGANPAARAIRLTDVPLDSGATLPEVVVTFQTWGQLNSRGDNAVLVEHALTGDSHVVGAAGPGQPSAGWWPDLIGPGRPLDTRELYVVAANVLGGCRGTTGPGSAAPDGAPWGARFPRVTIRDQVGVEALLADHLGVDVWRLVLGGSMGGMRAVEWAAGHPDRTQAALVIASAPWATADQIAWGRAQMQAIVSDPDFQSGDYYGTGRSPRAGLGLARQIAHTTYRSAAELEDRFGRAGQDAENPLTGGRFAVESYLDHQADKLVARFDAGSYLHLTAAMATHDVTRDRGSLNDVLGSFDGILRVAAVDSDRLFPVELSELMAQAHGDDPVRLIRSRHGHDGFLIETDQIAGVVSEVVADTRPARSRRVG